MIKGLTGMFPKIGYHLQIVMGQNVVVTGIRILMVDQLLSIYVKIQKQMKTIELKHKMNVLVIIMNGLKIQVVWIMQNLFAQIMKKI